MTNSDTRNEVAARVVEVICDTLAVAPEDLEESTRIVEDLGADSMAVVTLMIALDDEFDVELSVDDVPPKQTTVRWIVEYIKGKL